MSGNRRLVVLLGLLLVGWGAIQLVILPERRAPVPDPAEEATGTPPQPAEAVIDATAGRETRAEARSAESDAVEVSAPPAADVPESQHGDGALAIQVEDPDHKPLEGIRLFVVLGAEEGGRELVCSDLHQGGPEISILTDFVGSATYSLPSGRSGTLHAWSETSSDVQPRAIELEALAPLERRALVVILRRGRDTGLDGQVVDGPSGRPIAEASVLLRERDATIDGTETGEEGKFHIEWQGWRDVHLLVHAAGYSPALVPLTGEADPAPIRLWRSATLILEAKLERGPPLAEIEVSLYARLADALPEEQRTGGLLAEVIRAFASTASDGIARLEELPVEVPIELVLRGEAFGSARIRVAPVHPGEVRSLEWELGAGTTLTGRLLDQDDLPLGGQEIWLCACEDSAERYFVCVDRNDRLGSATTGSDGSFVLAGVHPGRYRIGPGPACSRPFLPSSNANDVAPWASILEVEEGVPVQTVLLHRPRELYVRGVVVDGRGAPHAADVTARHEGGSPGESCAGEFAVGPLIDDVHRVSATCSEPLLRSQTENVRPRRTHEQGEELRLVLGDERLSSLSGLVVDPETDRGLLASVRPEDPLGLQGIDSMLLKLQMLGPEKMSVAEIQAMGRWMNNMAGLEDVLTDDMGRFRIEGLAPGTYVLLARAQDSVGLARAVVPGPGDRVRDVIVRVPRPASVVVEEADYGEGQFTVLLEGLSVASGQWSLGEPFLVPAGLVTLELWDYQRTRFRTIDALPGGKVALDLRDPR